MVLEHGQRALDDDLTARLDRIEEALDRWPDATPPGAPPRLRTA